MARKTSLPPLVCSPSVPSSREPSNRPATMTAPAESMAIALPRCRVVLLEARERKAEWLERTIRELELTDRVEVRCNRFESLPKGTVAGFDCMTARALAPPEKTLSLLLPPLGAGSNLLLWHSRRQQTEISRLLKGKIGGGVFALNNTYIHLFAPINFSSHISEIGYAS